MKIIQVEKDVWETMLSRIEQLSTKVAVLSERMQGETMQDWLDNQDVCWALQISMRKLQSYREKGVIGYAQIGHKIFYKPDEVERLRLSRIEGVGAADNPKKR